MKLAMRKDVPVAETWDLTLLYKTEAEMHADEAKAQSLARHIVEAYKDRLSNAETINACLDELREVYRLCTLTGNYCDLAVSVDFYDSHNQQNNDQNMRIRSEIMSELAFVETEIGAGSEETLREAIAAAKENRGMLERILLGKPHQLSPETERALAALEPALGAPYNVYNSAKLMDMRFSPFTVGEETFPLGYSLFEDNYDYDARADVRRAAFKAFSDRLREYENVTATAYNAHIQIEKTLATLRGFDSVFDYLLFPQRVTREMYDRQIDLIMEKFAPHMRRYAALLKRIHGLEKMTYADLHIAVDPGFDPKITIEESKDYIEKGLSIMGEDYVEMVRTAYRERWVDFARNQGKSTGGFCASPYGKSSFILLSWNDRMADVITLAHELGHAGHFKACNAAQSITDTDVSTYFIEAPSTINELIMANYLLRTSDDKRLRRWVLSCIVGNTYSHNFVTHLLEAAYQREVYKIIDAGGSVQAETLSGIMRDTLQKFWGEDVEICEGAELTWMRQPHYYMGLYSYTYSAGLTVATQACHRMQTEGQSAVEDWKKVLRAGSTLDPLGLAKLAGVDISTDRPLLDTIAYIGSLIDEIERLTDELQK